MLEKEIEKSSKTIDMTVGSPLRHIAAFAVPLLIGTVFQQFYSFADTMIAGHNLGDNAIAAIGASSAIYSLLIAFANGLNSGYGLVLSRAFGAKDYKLFQKAAGAMIALDIAITMVLTVLSLLFLRPLMQLLHTPTDIFEQAFNYIFVILCGLVTTVFYNMCAAFLRSLGNSKTPLYFLILSCGINLSLDVIFIMGFDMGIVGAALATVIAEAASGLFCWIYLMRHYRDFLPQKADFKPEWKLLGEMLSTGLSMSLMLSVFSLGSIILQRSINHLGTDIIGAHTASRRIYEMLMMPLSTLATANATFVSQNFGASQTERIQTAMKKVMGLELLWSLLSVAVAFTGGRFLIVLLTGTSNEELIGNALLNLRLSTAFFFPLGILFVLRTAMQSMGRKIVPVLSSSIELLLKVLSCLILIPAMGYLGVAITEPIIWVICAFFLCVTYFAKGKKEKNIYLKGVGEYD